MNSVKCDNHWLSGTKVNVNTPLPPPHVHSTKLNIVEINFIMQKSEGEYKITKLCDCEIDLSRENNQVLYNASP